MSKVIDFFDIMSRDWVWRGMLALDIEEHGIEEARLIAWRTLLDCKRGDQYSEPYDPIAQMVRDVRNYG